MKCNILAVLALMTTSLMAAEKQHISSNFEGTLHHCKEKELHFSNVTYLEMSEGVGKFNYTPHAQDNVKISYTNVHDDVAKKIKITYSEGRFKVGLSEPCYISNDKLYFGNPLSFNHNTMNINCGISTQIFSHSGSTNILNKDFSTTQTLSIRNGFFSFLSQVGGVFGFSFGIYKCIKENTYSSYAMIGASLVLTYVSYYLNKSSPALITHKTKVDELQGYDISNFTVNISLPQNLPTFFNIGSCDTTIDGLLRGNSVVVVNGKGSFISKELQGEKIAFRAVGGGNLTIKKLVAKDLITIIEGAGNISINSQNLETVYASITGLGNICVYGDVKDVTAILSGNGSINVQKATGQIRKINKGKGSIKVGR